MKMRLITYGCGKKFLLSKFKPIKNEGFIKPSGGLWASPVNATYGWREWCEANDFGNLKHSFEFDFEGKAFVIDSLHDAQRLPWIEYYKSIQYPNFESLVHLGYDAIYLTERGEIQTRFSTIASLYGWDCESVLIMNCETIKEVEA